MPRVLVLHGPNLNLVGTREQSIYGRTSLKSINAAITKFARHHGVRVDIRQSNAESDLVSWIQEAQKGYDAIVINPAAFTHTSIAIRDAVAAAALPTVEVHLSNIYAREAFRQHSYVAGVALGQISGFGPQGYTLAIQAVIEHLRQTTPT